MVEEARNSVVCTSSIGNRWRSLIHICCQSDSNLVSAGLSFYRYTALLDPVSLS